MATPLSRRSFIKAGLIGGAVLAAAGGIYRATRTPDQPGRFMPDAKSRAALGAIAAAILKGAVPDSPDSRALAITRTETAIATLPLSTQKEIQDLFGLLALAPARRFLAGLPAGWEEAKAEDVASFLQSWRTHRLKMLQSAYHALHDLVLGAWYADESTWAGIGYPGPLPALS